MTGEVEHLVAEAPLVAGDALRLPLLASLARTRRPLPASAFRHSAGFSCPVGSIILFIYRCRPKRGNFFHTRLYGTRCQRNKAFDPFCSSRNIFECRGKSNSINEDDGASWNNSPSSFYYFEYFVRKTIVFCWPLWSSDLLNSSTSWECVFALAKMHSPLLHSQGVSLVASRQTELCVFRAWLCLGCALFYSRKGVVKIKKKER